MRGCCLEAAASLRRWLPVKNMSSRSPRVLRQLLFSPPRSSLFPLPSRKTLSKVFLHRAPPSPRGGRGCGWFSQLGARKAGPSDNSLFAGTVAWGLRRGGASAGGLQTPPRPRPPCFAESCSLFYPFYSLKQGEETQKYKSFDTGLKGGRLPPSPPLAIARRLFEFSLCPLPNRQTLQLEDRYSSRSRCFKCL